MTTFRDKQQQQQLDKSNEALNTLLEDLNKGKVQRQSEKKNLSMT